jgi:hypothetical protein
MTNMSQPCFPGVCVGWGVGGGGGGIQKKYHDKHVRAFCGCVSVAYAPQWEF